MLRPQTKSTADTHVLNGPCGPDLMKQSTCSIIGHARPERSVVDASIHAAAAPTKVTEPVLAPPLSLGPCVSTLCSHVHRVIQGRAFARPLQRHHHTEVIWPDCHMLSTFKGRSMGSHCWSFCLPVGHQRPDAGPLVLKGHLHALLGELADVRDDPHHVDNIDGDPNVLACFWRGPLHHFLTAVVERSTQSLCFHCCPESMVCPHRLSA